MSGNNGNGKRPNPPTGEFSASALTGLLMPWIDDIVAPTILQMDTSGDYYLPLFSTQDVLRKVMEYVGVEYTSIKQIEDGNEFLENLPTEIHGHPLRVILNIRLSPDGKVKYTEVTRRD